MKRKVEYLGFEGCGRTVADAKRDAVRQAEAVLRGSYEPKIIHYNGYAALVYREPRGWSYKLIHDEEGFRNNSGFCWCGDKEEAVNLATTHVVQLGMDCDKILTLGDVPDIVKLPKDRDEIVHYAEFQRRYREAKIRGMSNTDAHSYAGRDPFRPELWK